MIDATSGGDQAPASTAAAAVEADDPMVCFCNEIRLSAIVTAMAAGASTLTEIIDETWAGCGPCGGTCQPDIESLLEDWQLEAGQLEAGQLEAGALADRQPQHGQQGEEP